MQKQVENLEKVYTEKLATLKEELDNTREQVQQVPLVQTELFDLDHRKIPSEAPLLEREEGEVDAFTYNLNYL